MTTNESPAALLPEPINPHFWIDVIRTQAHVTDCREKQQALINAANKLAQYIAATAPAASESRGSVPDGFVLMPREATPEMRAAGAREVDWYQQNAADCYSAMLAAAPTPLAVSNGEPTAEQWRQAIRDRGLERELELIEYCARYHARSAAAKGEG